MDSEITRVNFKVLQEWATAVFTASGLSTPHAEACARMLVQTSLWGIDSHGVARIPHYLNRLSRGSISAQPNMEFHQTAAATGEVDGDHALGFLPCALAMDHAVELARASGAGVVGVRNSSHCGAIGLYARQATSQGMIGIAFTHSDSFVVPHEGTKPFFGTNPIAIAIPTTDPERPLCLDMATSMVPLNRIMNARRENKPIASGLAVDKEGRDTTDAHAVAALKPMAGHKGYAMAFLIDMLCGPLNGMPFGPHLNKMYDEVDEHRRLGSLMIAIDPDRFPGGATIPLAILAAIAEVKQQGEGIRYPGEPEYLSAEKRSAEGIPIEPGLRREFEQWSKQLGVSLFP
jgi:ureidoglycolate dehydrogenase (NAD+)